MKKENQENLIKSLNKIFQRKRGVSFSYLFGSLVKQIIKFLNK
jgi:predicted nucleotidyltransferase